MGGEKMSNELLADDCLGLLNGSDAGASSAWSPSKQAVRAGDIIYRLRTLARNDVMKREPTDVNVLISELTELIQLDAKTHEVQYRLELAVESPQANVDRARLTSEGEVEIAVCDTGPGVSPAIVPRLFDPFCTSKTHGTGLGLAMSRTIIRSHQGTLDYCPNLPHGACFTVRLPLDSVENP